MESFTNTNELLGHISYDTFLLLHPQGDHEPNSGVDREPVFKNVLAHSYPPINTYIMSFCLFWKFCKWYLPIHVLLRYFTIFFCLMCFWSVSRLIYALIYEKWKFIHNCSAVVCYSVIYSFCVIFYCMITTLYIYPFSTLGILSGFRVFWLRLL